MNDRKIKRLLPYYLLAQIGTAEYKNHKEIIANETAQINLQAAQNPEKSRSGGLQIVSMTELYDGYIHREHRLWTVSLAVPPLCGAPKVENHDSLWGSLPTMCNGPGFHCGIIRPKGDGTYLALEDDYAGFSADSPVCWCGMCRITCTATAGAR